MAAFAHAGGLPLIHVQADHIEPGKMFQVIAADLGQNAQVTLTLAAAGQTVGFGTITAGPDPPAYTGRVSPSCVKVDSRKPGSWTAM